MSDGAEVKIDGRSQSNWRTPFTAAAVPLGPRTVVFEKSGYVGDNRVVEVHAGRPAFLRVSMKVMTPTATTSIGSDPVGAAILIDGKEIGQVTPAQVVLGRGTHSIALRKAGFQEAATDVDLQEGQIYSFAPTLKPLDLAKARDPYPNFFARLFGSGGDKVPIEMQTTPPGAEILVNGQPYSKTTQDRAPTRRISNHFPAIGL
ncbi:MAG TPA: PEGA domain-containing protein [Terriglobales bacterium]|nr:PEGA domain-containing protein [Terriglobales bacterium]